ncbi:MAG: cupin domain-containing protein [Anaerolineae bacterium]
MTQANAGPAIVDPEGIPWAGHPRFENILMKPLITSATHDLASVARVHVPPEGVIGLHIHTREVEVVYVLSGESVLTLGSADASFCAGQVVAIPAGLEHGLRNVGDEPVELLTFFTPPIM